jgi:hypothetical protein
MGIEAETTTTIAEEGVSAVEEEETFVKRPVKSRKGVIVDDDYL